MDGQKITLRQVGLATLLIIFIMMFADFNNRWNEKQRLTIQHAQALEMREALLAKQAVLREQIEYASSSAAVEEWAYSEGGLARPGDVVIQPIPAPGETPEPTPVPEVQEPEQNNWDVWWSLFFDPENDEP